MSNKRTLVIDGNFMLKRMLREYTFKENPENDRINYLTDLANHLACEIERISGFCDNIIMVKDSHSWRKSIPLKPNIVIDDNGNVYKSREEELENYKSNRIQSDDRDWSAIFSTFVEFCECIQNNFNVAFINVPETEGDDCIWGVCNWLRTHKILSCVYCTDSDISQLVTPSNVILRRIKSKASPEGEIIVDEKFWELYTKENDTNDPMSLMLANPVKWAPTQEMFKGKSLDQGITICYPYYKILKMMFMGSGKDNVPEIFTWKQKTRYRHLSDKFVEDALRLTGKTKKEVTLNDLYNEPFLKTMIINICHVTKQTVLINHLDYLYELLLQNRKMNFLSELEIPKHVQESIFNSIESQVPHMKADFVKLAKSSNIIDCLHITKDKIYQQLGI